MERAGAILVGLPRSGKDTSIRIIKERVPELPTAGAGLMVRKLCAERFPGEHVSTAWPKLTPEEQFLINYNLIDFAKANPLGLIDTRYVPMFDGMPHRKIFLWAEENERAMRGVRAGEYTNFNSALENIRFRERKEIEIGRKICYPKWTKDPDFNYQDQKHYQFTINSTHMKPEVVADSIMAVMGIPA